METILNTGLGGSSGATWAPDDTIIFATLDPATGLQRVSADGGDVAVLTRPVQARGELDHLWPEMLPGGLAVLFTITATGGPDAAQVAVLDLATRTSRVVMPGGSHAHYVQSGHLIYTAGGTMRAVPFDLDRLETRGTPVTVLPRLVEEVAGSGRICRGRRRDPRVRGRARLRDGGEHPGVGGSAGPGEAAALRPRGPTGIRACPRTACAWRWPRETTSGCWISQAGRASQLTFVTGPNFAPVWTNDGNRVLFFSALGKAGLFWQAADGSRRCQENRRRTSVRRDVGRQAGALLLSSRGAGPDGADT